MGVQITFDPNAWAAAYPQFSNLTSATITGVVLPLATVYCRNDGGGPICDINMQTQALWLMVAHVAQILFGSTTQNASPLVGRVTNASEGSVSVASDWPKSDSVTDAWLSQTPYGVAFLALINAVTLGFYAAKQTPLNRPYIYGGLPGRYAGW